MSDYDREIKNKEVARQRALEVEKNEEMIRKEEESKRKTKVILYQN